MAEVKQVPILNRIISDEEYSDVFDEAYRNKAELLGCEVLQSNDYLLLLDIDSDQDYEFMKEQIARASEYPKSDLNYVEIQEYTSRSGNRHVLIWLWSPMSVEQRIMWQAALGSDRVREVLNLMRFRHGVEDTVRLFKPKAVPRPVCPRSLAWRLRREENLMIEGWELPAIRPDGDLPF